MPMSIDLCCRMLSWPFWDSIWPLSTYMVTIFTPPWYIQLSLAHRVATIFLFPTSIALYAIAMLVAEKSFRQHRNKTIVGVGLTVILITVVSDYFILRDLQLHLNIIIIILFICFVITGALVAKRLIGRLGSLPPEHAKRLEYVAFASTFGILFTVLFFLALVSYAYGIFPMIPSAKGGADYTDTPRASVSFSDESGEFKWTGRMI